jgi:hypothetical protein
MASKISELIGRLSRLTEQDLLQVEKCIRRLEPKGKRAWKECVKLKQEIRRLDPRKDSEKIEKLIERLLEVETEYDF